MKVKKAALITEAASFGAKDELDLAKAQTKSSSLPTYPHPALVSVSV